jgi:tetratricopeptide (TPR) repeat protein
MYESLTPFMPIQEALRSGGLDSLFAEEAPRVEAIYLITHSGLLIKEVVREETKLDPDIFSSLLTTVNEFISQSLSTLLGKERDGTINSLGFEGYRILIESGENANLVVVITGKENEFLISDMKESINKVHDNFHDILSNWDGDDEKIAGVENLISPLITSGKFDGIYYGKEDPKARRNLLFENVSMGIARKAETSPTLLCIEDLQWADSSTLALMHYITRNTKKANLVVLGTYRPEDVAGSDGNAHPLISTMQLMDREDLLEKMELGRLPEESINEFLISMLQKVDFTDDFKKRIYKETDGNPLFVIELIKFLVDEKLIQKIDGTWKLSKSLEEGTIPTKVLSVISRRLDRLKKEDRKALDYASVIGETFDSTLLASILKMDRVQLLERMRYLDQTLRLIHPQNGKFIFDHAKIKEALYNEIPLELKSEYHLEIANSIEKMNKDNFDNVIGDLAFHYYQSKNNEKALLYLHKAAEKAKKEYANEEAIKFYNFTLELEGNSQRRLEIFEYLGDIHFLIGNSEKSIQLYENAMKLADTKYKKAEIKGKIGWTFLNNGEYNKGLKICNEILSAVKGEDCKEEASAYGTIGGIYYRNGEFEKAFDYFNKSLEIQKKIGDQKGIATSIKRIGNVHIDRAEYDSARECYETSLKINEELDDQQGISSCLTNIGVIHHYKGEYNIAIDYKERSLDIANKIGNQLQIALDHINLAMDYIRLEDYNRALEYNKKGFDICENIGSKQYSGLLLMNFSKAYYGKRDLKRALDFGIRANEVVNGLGMKEDKAISNRLLGMIYGKQDMWEKSIENFEQSIITFTEIGIKNGAAETHYEFGLMWKAKGDSEKAKKQFNKALDIFENLNIEKKIEKVKAELENLP